MVDSTYMAPALSLTASQSVPSMAGGVVVAVLVRDVSAQLPSSDIVVSGSVSTVVVNARNFAIGEYSNFAYNSMAKFNGKYLYARADGIYEGGGNNDNGTDINASYKTGVIDVYIKHKQRLRDAYLEFRSDGNVELFTVGDEVNPRHYTVVSSVDGTLHERRIKFERGIRDRRFNFGISNINGASLEIVSARILTEPIRKRR